jgi:uncharacterized protein (TIRG00374 family)
LPRVSRIGVTMSVLVLVALVVFTLLHVSDAERFLVLVEHAEPAWVAAALGLQAATYACAGGIWRAVAHSTGNHLRLLQLARLALEKLSVDQLVPTGGMAGNLVVAAAMRRLGLPTVVVTEALLVDLLAYQAAYAFVAGLASFLLGLHHRAAPVAVALVAVFACILALVPVAIAWLLRHRDWTPGPRLTRMRLLERVRGAIADVSLERIRNPKLLALAAGLHLLIFVLDAGTLFMHLRATGTAVPVLTAFTALVVASLAGTFSLLPGGLGSFEAGCTATLALLGVPVEAALTGTLLLRGLTLWLPLLPGALLARRDLARHRAAPTTSAPRA